MVAGRVFQGTQADPVAVLASARAYQSFLTVAKLRGRFSEYTGNQKTGTFTPSRITYNDEGDAVAVTMTDLGTGTLAIDPEDTKGQAVSDQLIWTQTDVPAGQTAVGAAGSVLNITPDASTLNLAVSAGDPGISTVVATDAAGNTFTEVFTVTPSGASQLTGTFTPGPDQAPPAPTG